MKPDYFLFAALIISGILWGIWRYQQGRRRGYNDATADFVTALKNYKAQNDEEGNNVQ